jgi:hypothetical protein
MSLVNLNFPTKLGKFCKIQPFSQRLSSFFGFTSSKNGWICQKKLSKFCRFLFAKLTFPCQTVCNSAAGLSLAQFLLENPTFFGPWIQLTQQSL